ncbi:InlB B-repeat-containing protein [Bengtsoniella intestinalis]|uniref:InlB B-repeat-containing protein n=1 Tax=Bengtsoniella intestinalis TaxID=3073143 RepID=UPI00391F899D
MTKQIKKQLRCLLAVLLVMSQMVTMAAAAYTITFNGSVPTTAPTGATVTWNLDTSASGTTNGNTYTVSTESKYDYSDILELVDVPTATLVGYTFRNWADALGSAPSSNDSTNPSYYVFSSNTTYYANWTANQYTVTLDGNGGTFGDDETKEITQDYDYNTVITDTPTREGYDFTGWYDTKVADGATSSDTTENKVTNIPVVGDDDTLTLYAGWQVQTYDVTFETVTDVSYTGDSTATYGEAFTFEVSSTGEGTTITGVYYTVDNGKPTPLSGTADSYTILSDEVTGDINIFVTTNSLFSVQFQTATDEPHGSVSGTTFFIVEKDKTDTYTGLTVTTNTGYELTGWTTDTDPTSTVSDPTDVTVTADVTYTAVFEPIDYTITYNLNEGTNYVDAPTSYTIEDTIILGTPTKTGYDFGGWYNGASKVETINEQTGALTLTAKWTATEYGITYNLDGGTNDSKNPTIYTIEDDITLEDPTKEGYDFDGWYTDETCQTAQGTTIDVGTTGAVTLYAKWTANTYYLTFDAAGGTVAEDSLVELTEMTVTYDDEISTLPVVTKDGYEFDGWYIGTDKITADGNWTYAENKTATAKWTAKTYDLTFNAAGGSVDPASMTVTYDDEIGTLPVVTKDGYTFDGWYIGETLIDKDTVWNYTEGKEATAQWTANEYAVTFTVTEGVAFTVVGGLDDTDGYTATYDQTEDITFEISLTDVDVNFVTYKVGTAAAVEIEPVDGIYTVPASAITGVIVISANVTGLHVVTFEAGENGTLVGGTTSYSVRDGEEPDTIPTPTPNAGYEFKEWQNAGDAVDFVDEDVTITAATTFTAVFEPKTYTVSYVMNDAGADPVADGTVHYGETLPLPEDPEYSDSESDYHFNGWVVVVDGEDGKETKTVTAATVIGTDIIDPDIIDSETITVYATWKTINVDISIDIDVNVDVDVDVSAGSSDEDVAEIEAEKDAIIAFNEKQEDPSENFLWFTIDLTGTVVTVAVDATTGEVTETTEKVDVYEITGPEGYLAPSVCWLTSIWKARRISSCTAIMTKKMATPS